MKPGSEHKALELRDRLRAMDVDAFVRKVLRGVDRNRPIIIVPPRWKILWWLERLSPSLSLWVWRKVHAQYRVALAPHRLPKE